MLARILLIAVFLVIPMQAFGQCSGNFPANTVCGSSAGGVPKAITLTFGGSVGSVSNSDSTLTVTPTTGTVVASLNLSHANTWTSTQTFPNVTVTSLPAGTVCLQATNGVIQSFGAGCAGGGGGTVNSVSNSDGTLTIAPTTGAVVASLALGHANTWTALQIFGASTNSIQSNGVIFGTGTFVASPNYHASNAQTIGYQAILGTVGSPNGSADSPFIFEKLSSVVSSNSPNGTIYTVCAKYSSALNGRCTTIFGEAVDQVGGATSFVEGARFQATLSSAGAGGGAAYGVICSAGDDSGIAYTFIVGCEADVENNSGVDATVSFNKNKFIAGFLSTNFTSNKSDVGFITNPFNTTPFIYGVLIPNGSIDSTGVAYYSNAVANAGLDVSLGVWTTAAVAIPNNSPITALNFAGSTQINLMYLNTSNQLILGAGTVAPGVSCASGTVNGATVVIVGGVVTHC